MSPIINPYYRNKAIVDRSKESRLFSPLVTEGGSLAVYGDRYIGKTFILNYIANPPNDWQENHFLDHIFVFFNCPDTVIPFSPNNFWIQVTKNLDRKLESSAIKDKCRTLLARSIEGLELTHNDFHEILDVAADAGKRIGLVLDDFDTFIRTDIEHLDSTRAFLQGLRSLTTRDSNKANLVVSTRYSLQEICKPLAVQGISPFDNGFTPYRLQRFREKEILQLLRRVEDAEQLPFSSAERSYIAYLSGFHPKLAQIAAAEVFDQRIDLGTPLSDLTPVGEKFKSESNPIFESLWEGASEIERLLLMLIALEKLKGKLLDVEYDLSDLKAIFSKEELKLIELTERGLLNKLQTNPPKWDIFSPIFHWWILKEIESSDPEILNERLRVWGNLVTQKQAGKLRQVVDFVKTNKDTIVGFGRLILRIVGEKLPPM